MIFRQDFYQRILSKHVNHKHHPADSLPKKFVHPQNFARYVHPGIEIHFSTNH